MLKRGMSVRRLIFAFTIAAVCGACSVAPAPAEQPTDSRVHILVFGDTGYDYDWLEAEDHEQPLDGRSYIVAELDDWIEDGRPIGEFRLSPFHFAEQTGGWVPASGMWPVANAMRAWCAAPERCDLGVMLGDNIYPAGATLGADGRDDAARFEDLLHRPYIGLQQQDPGFVIYPVMGNHDWETSREGALAQLEYLRQSPLYRMENFWYQVEVAPGVEVFGIDTSLLLAGHPVHEETIGADGSPQPGTEMDEPDPWLVPRGAEREQAQWLENALRESKARWKLVIAHHPPWSGSSGKYEQAKVLRAALYPSLCRYADAFLAGHEHTLEIHTDDCRTELGQPDPLPLVTLVSGAAAKQRPLHSTFMAYQDRAYPQKTTHYARGQVWGFAGLELAADSGEITILSTPDAGTGEVVEEYRYRFQRRSGR